MTNESIKIVEIQDLVPGMFVARVTKQSGKLRIKTEGLVKTFDIINVLQQKGILELEVDLSRSNLAEIEKHTAEDAVEEVIIDEEPKKKSVSEGEALNQAQELYDKAKEVHRDFLLKARDGQQAETQELIDSCADIVDCVFEHSNAISCLTLIKDSSHYLFEHSVNCSILMAVFAKHLGFDRELIDELSLGGLLMDTGMITVPTDIYEKRGPLTESEWDIVRTHVDFSIELVEQSGDVSDNTLSVIANHHERLDGSGYPAAKEGDKITVYGRMAAIVDAYDAMTSNRPHRASLSPTAALKKLLSDDSGKLDQSLVQQFIKCIGVHPVGSLVRLRSNKLGIIIRSNDKEPLKPLVMTFYSIRSEHHTEVKRLDLSKVDDDIVSTVRPEEFKMNLNKFFREVFLSSMK